MASATSAATVQGLLGPLDQLPHSIKMKRMVELGKLSAAGDPQSKQVVAGLEAEGSFGAKLLALQSCYGSRDVELALRQLQSPSRNLRDLAARVLICIAGDDQLVQVRWGAWT